MSKKWIFIGLVLLVLFAGCVQDEATNTTSTTASTTVPMKDACAGLMDRAERLRCYTGGAANEEISAVALEYNDSDLCNLIDTHANSGHGIFYCKIAVATKTKNISVCYTNLGYSTTFQGQCILSVIKADDSLDASVCNKAGMYATECNTYFKQKNKTTTTTTTTDTEGVLGYYITTPPFCSDSDGGVNEAIKGSVTVDIRGEGIRSSFWNQTDYCFDQSTLIEYACDCYGEHRSDCITEAIAQEDIDCQRGCFDGACI